MKIPFGFGGKSGKNKSYRDLSEEEYMDDEYIAEEYTEEEYTSEEYTEEEYTEEEYYIDEYADEEYSEEENNDEEYYIDEYVDEECSDEYSELANGEYQEEESAEDDFVVEDVAAAIISEEFEEISYVNDECAIDSYEQDDSYEEYDYAETYGEKKKKGLPLFFSVSEIMEKLVVIGGTAVLLAGLIIGGLFIYSSADSREGNEFLNVGNQLAQIEVIGQSGLLAVSNAQKAVSEAAEIVEEDEESTEYEEEEYKAEITVKLSMASIEKDLKIKFINQETGKLVGNVPFSIQVTDPDGKESLWSDDDMDGIIYKKNLKAGKYKISVNAFKDEKYRKYGLPTSEQKVDVKAEIEYKKVDVADEVKSEAQVDVQKEDTKINETVVEGYLTDTVSWVESTATLVSYTEVAKENIVNPMQLAMNTNLIRLSDGNTVSGGDTATPTPSPMVITLDKQTATVYMDNPVTIEVTKVENEMKGAVITAASSNTSVATVSVKDKKITVTGVTAGEATIAVNCSADAKVSEVKEDGSVVEKTQTFKAVPVTCTIIVKVNPQKDTTTVLKDNQGREVYVLENQNYRIATHADYYTHSKFYIKGEAKYTGWQTLDGKRYYYDASGKAVTGEQVIQGVKYNFASDGSLVTGSGTLGIDVSKWNGNIDWTAVKNSGVSYVIIRCGYRGSSQGALIKDSKFETNIKGATNAGLKVGVYFFSQAIDKNEAVEEASMVLDCIKNYKISYPIFLDVEPSGGRADSIDVATRTAICKTFCETIQSYGYTAGIYANKNWFTEKINTRELSSSYKIWLAQYASAPTYTGRYDMWQYKSTGKINGISGDVDMNLSYLGY